MTNFTRSLATASLLVVAAASAVVAVRSHAKVDLAQAATRRASEQEAQARAITATLQQRARELSAHVVKTRDAAASRPTATPPPPPTKEELDRSRNAAIAQAMAMMRVNQFVNDERFLRPRFEQLGLSASQWESYKKLRIALLDAQQAARTGGASGPGLKEAFADAQAGFDSGVRTLMGETAYAEFQAYQQRLAEASKPPATAVRELTAALVYSESPLQPHQAEQLRMLVEAEVKGAVRPGSSNSPGLSPEAAEQAQAFLTPPQMDMWRRLQGIYRAQRELDALVATAPKR